MVLPVFTVVSFPPLLVSSFTEVFVSYCFIKSCLFFSFTNSLSLPLSDFGMYDSLKPVVLVGDLKGNFLASFLLGWGVTTGAGIASYPLDTIRRRMMMTSGEKVHYNG